MARSRTDTRQLQTHRWEYGWTPKWLPDGDTAIPCREMSPEIFFPYDWVDEAAAKAACAGCPIKADCLAHALEWHEAGIWGGTNEAERRRLRQGRRGKSFATPWVSIAATEETA